MAAFSTDSIVASILADVRRQYGERADVADIAACHPSLLRAYRSGVRVKVERTYGDGETYTRTGTVSRTTGWRPALLLMYRSNSAGSSDLITPDDRVTAVKIGRKYVKTINVL
jgi:L-fucose isomerase-like protein